jgi:hypothetical protein
MYCNNSAKGTLTDNTAEASIAGQHCRKITMTKNMNLNQQT